MDCRIDVYAALGLEPGEAHVIRNAGGLVTDDVVRSLAISQWCLGTSIVLVVQHTGCGLIGLDGDELARRIMEESGVAPDMAFLGFDDLEGSLRDGLARLRAHPMLRHRDGIQGLIFDVETGRLREVA